MNDNKFKKDKEGISKQDINNLIEYAKKNSDVYNSKVVENIITKCMEDASVKSYPGIPSNGFYSKEYRISDIINAIIPSCNNKGLTPNGYRNKDLLEYNKNNDNLFVLFFDGKSYSIPALLDKKLFEDLGFNVDVDFEFVDISGNKESCLNLIKSVMNNNNPNIGKNLMAITHRNSKELFYNDKVINGYISNSLNDADELVYIIFHKILKNYKNEVDTNSLITTIKTVDYSEIDFSRDESWMTRKFHEVCECMTSPIIFVPNNNRFLMFFEEHLRKALAHIYSTCTYNNGVIKVTTDTKKFQELVDNFNKNNLDEYELEENDKFLKNGEEVYIINREQGLLYPITKGMIIKRLHHYNTLSFEYIVLGDNNHKYRLNYFDNDQSLYILTSKDYIKELNKLKAQIIVEKQKRIEELNESISRINDCIKNSETTNKKTKI